MGDDLTMAGSVTPGGVPAPDAGGAGTGGAFFEVPVTAPVAEDRHERIRVMVETNERSFRGYIYKPVKDERFRLSDYLNTYEKSFIALSEVIIQERGHQYRAGDKRPFVAIAIASVTYITPLEDHEP